MKINRILLIIVLATINFQSFAQTFGVKAGLNMSDCAIKIHGDYLYTKIIFGLNLGGTAEFKIGDAYSIETGLIFNNKGFRLPISGGTDTITNLVYLDIPINAKYGFDLGENKLYLIAGPYIGFGIVGLYTHKANGERYGEKVKWGNNVTNNELKRLDYGINLGAEFEFGAIGVGLQYGLGLANLRPAGHEYSSQRNRLLSIYLAYKFGKK